MKPLAILSHDNGRTTNVSQNLTDPGDRLGGVGLVDAQDGHTIFRRNIPNRNNTTRHAHNNKHAALFQHLTEF